MSSEKPAATSASSPSGSIPTVTNPSPAHVGKPPRRGRQLEGAVGSPALRGPRHPRDARRPVAGDRRGESEAVRGDPREQPSFAGRLDTVTAESLQDIRVGTDPGQAGRG